MSATALAAAQAEVMSAMTRLRAVEASASGQELIDHLTFGRMLERQARHDMLGTIARLDREGEFSARNVYPAPAVTDLLRCDRSAATRLVRLAARVFPTALTGDTLEPRLPATAEALGDWTIDQEHAEVINWVLASRAAARLAPPDWAAAERQCAEWATLYTPRTLRRLAEALIEQLDSDGAEPDVDDDAQTNEVFLTPDAKHHHGGRITGRLDSPTFDALVQALDGLVKPSADEGKSLAERRADALGDLAEYALDKGDLPECGGEKPHLTMIVRYTDLKKGLRGGSLTATGCRIGPRQIRRLACDTAIIPLLLCGKGQPLDVGREKRTATRYQRRILAARDGGCAYPGCDRTPRWCSAHHIRAWAEGGRTDINNLVNLCRTHHIMVHNAGWVVRIRDGLPEFIPPKWLDHQQTPRRKPSPHRTDDHTQTRPVLVLQP